MAARRLILSPRRPLRIILYAWAAVFVPLCLWLTYFGWVRGRWHPLLAPLIGAGLFLALYVFVVLPWNARHVYPPRDVTGELAEEGLTMTMGSSTDRLPWSQVVRWKRNRKVVLLFVADDVFNVIPLRAFPNPADRASALAFLQHKLGPPAE